MPGSWSSGWPTTAPKRTSSPSPPTVATSRSTPTSKPSGCAERLGPQLASAWRAKGWGTDGGAFVRWHITSTDLNPVCFPLLNSVMSRRFAHAVAFHGFNDEPGVLIGGTAPAELKERLRQAIQQVLPAGLHVRVALPTERYGGDDPNNIVNRLSPCGGIQIEQGPSPRERSRLRHRRRRGRLLPPGRGASRVVGAPQIERVLARASGGDAVTRGPRAWASPGLMPGVDAILRPVVHRAYAVCRTGPPMGDTDISRCFVPDTGTAVPMKASGFIDIVDVRLRLLGSTASERFAASEID